MTIIAASRSQRLMLADTLIMSDSCVYMHATKIFRTPMGHLVGAAGDNVPCSGFLAWAMAGKEEMPPAELWSNKDKDLDGIMLTVDGRLLYYNGPRPDEALADTLAVGIGFYQFNAAIAAGAGIHRAVAITCEQNRACGGIITELTLGKPKHKRKA
jgi:hypothetical protein